MRGTFVPGENRVGDMLRGTASRYWKPSRDTVDRVRREVAPSVAGRQLAPPSLAGGGGGRPVETRRHPGSRGAAAGQTPPAGQRRTTDPRSNPARTWAANAATRPG